MLSFILLVVGVLAQQTFAEEPEAIIDGQDAVPGEFPYQVSLRLDGSHICGGSIIGPTKILTAAYCVYDIPCHRNLTVATGTIDISGGQLHEVKRTRVHPEYSHREEDAFVNDVAVITLSEPIQYNEYQKSIALTETKPVEGQQCTLAGWGWTRNGSVSRTLQKMNQTVVSHEKCQERYSYLSLIEGHTCAYARYGIGACVHDNGGPLVSSGKQIGIFSLVSILCAKRKPDIYTDVYHYRNFILTS